MLNRPFKTFWEGLVEPASSGDTRERHLSRTLNIILLLFLLWGIGFEIQSTLSRSFLNTRDLSVLIIVGILALAYLINRRGQFRAATLLTIGLFIAATFAFALWQPLRGPNHFAVLYYLIVAILMSELFFSMRGYLIIVTTILVGLL